MVEPKGPGSDLILRETEHFPLPVTATGVEYAQHILASGLKSVSIHCVLMLAWGKEGRVMGHLLRIYPQSLWRTPTNVNKGCTCGGRSNYLTKCQSRM